MLFGNVTAIAFIGLERLGAQRPGGCDKTP